MLSHTGRVLDTAVIIPSSFWAETIYNDNVQFLARMSATTFLVYDIIITMDKEVKYYWKRPFKPISLVYFLNRYFGLLSALVDTRGYARNVTGSLCAFTLWFRLISGWIGIIAIDAILLIRVIALYGQSRKLSTYILIFFVMQAAAMLGITIQIGLSTGVAVGIIGENITECVSIKAFPKLWNVTYGVPTTAFELTLMILSIYKAVQFWKETEGYSGFKLMNVLVRDQTVYSVLVMAFTLAMVNIDCFDNGMVGAVSSFTNATVPCILGSRILLNIREAGERSTYTSGGSGMSGTLAISDIRFA